MAPGASATAFPDARIPLLPISKYSLVTWQTYQNEVAAASSGNTKYEIVFSESLTITEATKAIIIKPGVNMDVNDQAGNVLSDFPVLQVMK